ncbi:MAG: hypothetical protein AB7E36_14130 [Salinivirgaceae bacterium]
MKKEFYILLIFIAILSCGKNSKNNGKEFNKIAKVTIDSCKNWGKPLTSFEVKFPSKYQINYNTQPGQYMALTLNNSSNIIIQQISFGRSENIDTEEKLKFYSSKMEKALNMTKGYIADTCVYEKYAQNDYFICKGIFDFSLYNVQSYEGKYNFSSFLILPKDTEYNGVAISIMTKKEFYNKELANKAEEIIETLRFKND